MRATDRRVLLAAAHLGEREIPPCPPGAWRRVRQRAVALGLAGHLRQSLLCDPARRDMPANERAALDADYYAIAARNADLLKSLGEVLRALAAEDIDVIVLKGAALVESAYGNVAVRPMHDADILVRERDLAKASRILGGLGFAPDEWYQPSEWYEENLHHLVPLKRGRVTIEVHRELLPAHIGFPVPLADLWSRARPSVVAGAPTFVLSAEDELIHLVLHLALSHHFEAGIGRLRDVAQVIRTDTIDWDAVVTRSAGRERVMALGLEMARALVGAEVDPGALRTLHRTGRVTRLDALAMRRLVERLCLRLPRENSAAPEWLLVAVVEATLAGPGWLARVGHVGGRVREELTERGKQRGYGRFAMLYGILIHPWVALTRRVRGTSTPNP